MSEQDVYQPPQSDLRNASDGDYQYAGFWVRVGASIIDSILLMLIIIPLTWVIYGAEYWSSAQFVMGFWDIIISYVFPFLAVVLFWAYKSATPGKMILGLKIISLGENETLSNTQLVGRYLGYIVSMVPLMLGCIWIAFDKRKQGWHDKLAGTVVIKVRS